MTDDEKIAGLQGMLSEPEGKYTHDQVRARLGQLYQTQLRPGEMYGSPPPPPPPPPKRTPFDWVPPLVQRAAATASEYAPVVGEAANRFINTAGLGLPNAAEDAIANLTHGSVRIGDTPAQRQDFEKNHPTLANAADAAGYMAPSGELNLPFRGVRYAIPAGGIPDAIAKGVGRGVDDITGALARRYASSRAARIAEKVVGNTAASMGTAGTVRAAEGLVRGETPDQAGTNALYAATSPEAVVGGASFGTASGLSREGAAWGRAHSSDIRALDSAGLEPGPIPGRPVIRKDMGILKQTPVSSEPPPLIGRATPATRRAAGRASGDTIEDDLNATEAANNARYGEIKEDVMSRQGRNPAHLDPALATIDAHLNDLGVHPETKAKLRQIRNIIEAPPGAKAPGIAVPTKGGRYAPVSDVDGLRRLADQFADQDKLAGAADVPLRQVAAKLRGSVETAAPALAELNKRHSEIMTGIAQRRALLGDPEHQGSDRNPFAQEREGAQRAARVGQIGEETATAGGQTTDEGSRMERLAAMGPQAIHPGPQASSVATRQTFNVPTNMQPSPSYGATLAPPRLQLAQENIQLSPSKMFSGARSGPGAANRLATFLPERVAYPLARRLGDASVGTRTIAADPLIRAIMARQPTDRSNDNAH